MNVLDDILTRIDKYDDKQSDASMRYNQKVWK
jgi:hypothetical protein